MNNQISSQNEITNPYTQPLFTSPEQPDPNLNSSSAPYYSLEISSNKPATSDPLAHLEDGLEGQAQKKFIMKVYIILAMQLAITVAVCFVSYYVRPFMEFQYNNQWVMWVLFVVIIVVELMILLANFARKHPFNLILLLIFTLCEAYVISFICSMVAMESGAQVVVVAAVMTLAVVLGLTLYAIFTPSDFTIKWGIIVVICVAMLMLGIFSLFIWSPFLTNLYCTLGVILFGVYLVIDTQLIIGGNRSFRLSHDDHVIGALILYIDIIQIFLYILQLLSKK